MAQSLTFGNICIIIDKTFLPAITPFMTSHGCMTGNVSLKSQNLGTGDSKIFGTPTTRPRFLVVEQLRM